MPPLRETPRYSIVIPAHNEEHRIGATLAQYVEEFRDSEIIVVLNGCSDRTREVVAAAQAHSPNVHLVEIPDPVGKGGAVRAGFLVSAAEIVGYVDADGSTPACEMRRLFERLGDDDGVIASRWLPGSRVAIRQPIQRRVASRCFNFLVRRLFGLRFSDTQCGAKAFRRSALERVMRDVETANLAFDVDLLFLMNNHGLRIHEEPTVWFDTGGSRVRLVSSSFRMGASLARLRLHHSFLRLVVPIFDHYFPTAPVRLHDCLRILVVNWRDPKNPKAGGAEAYLFEQAKYWVAWGHQVEWLTAGFPGAKSVETIDGVRVRRVGNALTVYAAIPIVYLREFRDRFDVVLDSENGIPFFTPLYSLKPKVCIVYHVHQEVFRRHLPSLLSYPLMWCEAKLVPFLYRNAHFVTISEDTRREMLRLGVSKREIGLVHCGVDSALVPGEKSASPTVLYLGRLKAYKRVDLLINAFVEVLEHVPDALLIIAGAGDDREQLESLVRSRGLERSIRFEGFVSDARKGELLRQAWVSVAPSLMEGWGISVIESNACGTSAIAFDVPGLSESIVDGVSGMLVAEGGNLAPTIVQVLSDSGLRSSLDAGALQRAQLFSWEAAAASMLNEIMTSILGGRVCSVALNGRWTLLATTSGRRPKSTYALSNVVAVPTPVDSGSAIESSLH